MSVISSFPISQGSKRCRHFGSCGGCSHQDLAYEDQLTRKKSQVAQLLKDFISPDELSIVGSPSIWNYRNKMEFSFGDVYPPVEGSWLKLGMKPKGRWYQILDLEECFLPSMEAAQLLASVRRWAQSERVTPYNSHKKEGTLRHLVIREAKNNAERMVILVTTSSDIPKQSFVDAVLSVYPATTILVGSNLKAADTAISDSLQILTGPGSVTESLHIGNSTINYRISPHSFFQTNTKGTEVLYGLLRSWADEIKANLLLDLYCGGGGITLALATQERKVIGVELNPQAIKDAKDNANLNGLNTCDFYQASVEFFLPCLLDMMPQAVIVDPPRAGLHRDAIHALLEHRPPVIFYVSCNPESLARDLASLIEGYRVERAQCVDLFPHTDHVETVMWLQRR